MLEPGDFKTFKIAFCLIMLGNIAFFVFIMFIVWKVCQYFGVL